MDDVDTDQMLDATTALIPPLMAGIDMMNLVGRHMHPPQVVELAAQAAPYSAPLQEGLAAFQAIAWPEHLQGFAGQAIQSAGLLLRAMDELAAAPEQPNPAMGGYRAMGFNTLATEALYPLTAMLPPVSRFFLDPEQREDEALVARLAAADGSRPGVGVMHADNAKDQRGGFSVYVPEYYDSEAVPLIVALHGGSGHGRSFLWTWLRTARTANAVVISPTSSDGTWSLMGPDVDSARLYGLVEYASSTWNIDPQRILLTGMSDGGTFSYVCGLQHDSPFTHLAPCAASFHPMLVEVAEAERLRGLPIYLMHGALDWMFPVDVAREANAALSAAGADVVYREIADLSHTYPVDENPAIMRWLSGQGAPLR